MIILAVRVRGEFFQRRQRARRGAGRDVASMDQQLLPDLQRPVELPVVQRQNCIHLHLIGVRDGVERVVGRHGVDDLAVGVRRALLNHTDRGGRGVADRVGARDEQHLPDLQLVGARDVVPDLDVFDGHLVSDGDGPQRLAGFDGVEQLTLGVGGNHLHRHDDAVIAHVAAGRQRADRRDIFAARVSGSVGCLQDVVIAPASSGGHARAHVTVGRVDRGNHVRGIRPDHHDLIQRHVADSEVFGAPHLRSAAVPGGLQPPGNIANVPGHAVGRHDLGGGLRHGIDDGVFDQRGQAVAHAQRVHGNDQVVRGHVGCQRSGLHGSRRANAQRAAHQASQQRQQENPADEF